MLSLDYIVVVFRGRIRMALNKISTEHIRPTSIISSCLLFYFFSKIQEYFVFCYELIL